MANAYGKKKLRGKTPAQKSGFFTAVLLAFVSGYIIASIFDAESLGNWLSRMMSTEKSVSSSRESPVTAHKAELPKPKFEFYTLLSKDHPTQSSSPPLPKAHPLPSHEVREMSKAIHTKIREASPLPPLQKTTAQHYDVQIASYNKKEDADRLKATLLLKDYSAQIQPINQNNAHWYRVVIGPYPSMREAEKAQLSVARSEHIMGIIRRLDA